MVTSVLNSWKREALKRVSCGDFDMQMYHSLRCRHEQERPSWPDAMSFHEHLTRPGARCDEEMNI